jgi:LmeA-like phospholipid-binding
MRALRTLLILVVVLAGLFTVADRVAVNIAEGRTAQEIRTTQNLGSDPDVSIHGFPFLTQVASGELDDVQVRIKDFPASSGEGGNGGGGTSGTILVHRIDARLKGVTFSDDFSSGAAREVTGTATVTYAELLKSVRSQSTDVAPGVTARVTGLSDGGEGRIKSVLEVSVLGRELPGVPVVSSVTVTGGSTVHVRADSLPSLGIDLSGTRIRDVTDFSERIEDLPGGIRLTSVRAGDDGIDIAVQGSHVRFTG